MATYTDKLSCLNTFESIEKMRSTLLVVEMNIASTCILYVVVHSTTRAGVSQMADDAAQQ